MKPFILDRFKAIGRSAPAQGAVPRGSTRTPASYWAVPATELLTRLGSRDIGLSADEAERRLTRDGANELGGESKSTLPHLIGRQFRSPLTLLLLAAVSIAALAKQSTEAILIACIVLATSVIGLLQDYRASNAIAALRLRLATRCLVRRGAPQACATPVSVIVEGDVVELSAGSLIPADGVLLEARDCFVVQAALTGESLPVEKSVGTSPPDAPLAQRTNVVFAGSSVRSGTATLLVAATGQRTVMGGLAGHLRLPRPESDFERGLRQFSGLLTQLVLVLVVVVVGANVMLERPPVEAVLFAIALAVGMTPELLPAIVTYTLARGARDLSAHGVLVRELPAIENLGSMTILCSDKTGTLTAGAARLAEAVDATGAASTRVRTLGIHNAMLQTGLTNPLDEVLTREPLDDALLPSKVDERPYDFTRKCMSVAVRSADGFLTITKGAPTEILRVCAQYRRNDGLHALDATTSPGAVATVESFARKGMRVLAVATKSTATARVDETGMTLEGLLVFDDPIKPDVVRSIADLAALGVRLRIITGDNEHTARHVASLVGLADGGVMTGAVLRTTSDEALLRQVEQTHVFAELEPSQKERVVVALRKAGHVVGYLGDGINDAPALHAADVGISVEGAVDVAREAADIVLLSPSLDVVARGIRQGRTTFANTQKYILSTTSANFGNMLSMAAASLFLPFLPLTAVQILLNNLLTDLPALSLATDRIDAEQALRPSRWNMHEIRRFAVAFGVISSLFDLLTFAVLLRLLPGDVAGFRSGWFVESLATEVLVLLVLRSRRPVLRTVPGLLLGSSTAAVLAGALWAVQGAPAAWLGFEPLPAAVLLAIAGITAGYVLCVETLKGALFRASAH